MTPNGKYKEIDKVQPLPRGCVVTFWVAIAIFMFITFCAGLRNCVSIPVN